MFFSLVNRRIVLSISVASFAIPTYDEEKKDKQLTLSIGLNRVL